MYELMHLLLSGIRVGHVCCSARQIEALQEDLKTIASWTHLDRCPTCFENLKRLLCHIICHPMQYHFVQPVSQIPFVGPIPPSSTTLEQFQNYGPDFGNNNKTEFLLNFIQ